MDKFWDTIVSFFKQSGIAGFFAKGGWMNLIMIAVALLLLFLAIKKKFEPYLLIPIAFGMLLVNLPGVGEEIFREGTKTVIDSVTGEEITVSDGTYEGLFGFLYYGVKWGIYPCLIFLCIGATTDFGPLIANKKTMLLGAAAQIGIFVTFIGAIAIDLVEFAIPVHIELRIDVDVFAMGREGHVTSRVEGDAEGVGDVFLAIG